MGVFLDLSVILQVPKKEILKRRKVEITFRAMGIFVKIVNRSITLLFSQEVMRWMFEYASSVSVTAISVRYGCLWWSDCWLGEIRLSQKTHYAVTLCHLIYLMWNFDFAQYASLFSPNLDICVLGSELSCKRNIESHRLPLTLYVLSQTKRSNLGRCNTNVSLLE